MSLGQKCSAEVMEGIIRAMAKEPKQKQKQEVLRLGPFVGSSRDTAFRLRGAVGAKNTVNKYSP